MKRAKRSETKGKSVAKAKAKSPEQAKEPFTTTSPMALLQHELECAENEPKVPDVPISPLINVWASRPVAQLPVIEMVRWRFFEFAEAKTRHLFGFAITTHSGRRSTAIVSIDPKTMRAVTESGREYQLIGPPGYDDDAQYILEMSTLVGAQWTDVTKEVCAELGITSTVN